jgi:hypothetical protein
MWLDVFGLVTDQRGLVSSVSSDGRRALNYATEGTCCREHVESAKSNHVNARTLLPQRNKSQCLAFTSSQTSSDSDEEEVSVFGWLGSLWGREGAGRIGDRRDRRIGRGKEGIRRGWDAWAFGALIGYRTRRVLYLMHCSSAPDGM